MSTYLVTGGAGFIGSHIAERLLEEGHHVRILDDFSTGQAENVEAIRGRGPDRLRVITGDLRDVATVTEAVGGTDGVFHEAALGSVPRSIDDPRTTHDVNITGTLNVLLAMRETGVPRIVFAGSSSVYGSLEKLPKEEVDPTAPISPYGLSKLAGEEYLRLFRELYGMETVTLRYYNVFGPRQNPEGQYAAVIPLFIRQALRDQPAEVHGDGEQSRDFTFVSNVVDANLLAMTSSAEAVSSGLFNVAEGGRHSLNDLLRGIERLTGKPVQVAHAPARAGDVRHSQADTARIRNELGYVSRIGFEDGLARTVEHFREAARH